MNKKRHYLQVIYDLLSSIPEDGIKPTRLAYKALIDYEIMLKYLKLLESEGLVFVDGKIYITKEGKEFLAQYEKLKELLSIE
jgi:predicted transcriptional regulator